MLQILLKMRRIRENYRNDDVINCQKNKMFINIKYDFDKYNKIAK